VFHVKACVILVWNSAVSSLYPEGGAGERRLNSEHYHVVHHILIYAFLHKLQVLNKMATTSHGVVAGMMHMYKITNKASRINKRDQSSFLIETELRKLLLKLAIDNNTHLCFPYLCKPMKKKSWEESFAPASEEIMQNYRTNVRSTDFVPSIASTPTKSAQTLIVEPTTCTSLPPGKMWQHKILRMELVKYLLRAIAAALLRALFYQNGLHVKV